MERAASPKYTAPLVDTPQTITVISRANIEQQNLLTLRDVLANVPGITYSAGEGGFGYGDLININGVDARNDITVNGVRSSSSLSRNETYNIEQVEVTTGANSVYSGGGNVAGSINLVTKQPLTEDKIQASAGVGTDNYWRGTVDINKRLTDMIAVRLNAVYHQNDVPGRDYEFSDRWGVAPSVRIGLDGPTSLVVQYEHLTDHALPFYGIPYYPTRGGLLPGISRSTYFGVYGADKQNSKTDAIQAIASHEFSDKLRIRLLNRYENILQETNTTNPGGAYCLSNGTGGTYNPAAALTAANQACATGLTANTFQANNPLTANRSTARRIHNETLASQLDVNGTVNFGSIENTFNVGGSYLWENFDQIALGSAASPPPGGWPIFSTLGPSPLYTGPLTYTKGATTLGTQEVFAGYLFDTMKFTDWLQLNGGIRYEKVKGHNSTQPLTGDRTGYTESSNNLFSYRAGLVVKPTPDTSIYAAYGNSRRPSQSAVSAGCTQIEPTPTVPNPVGNNCTTKPETTKNYEIGAKAEFFDKALLVSFSLFQNDRDTIRVASADPTVTDQVLDGKQRTKGVNFSVTGSITPEWSISGSFQHVTAKVRQGVSDYCLANPGASYTPQGTTTAVTCANSPAVIDPTAGYSLALAPNYSGSAFTSYRFPFGLEVGYGLNYQGKYLLNTPNLASLTPGTTTPYIPYYVSSYVTQRLMVAYTINDNLRAQVNVQNLFNEKYLTTVRTSTGSSWGTPGAERSAVFSLTGSF
ncbi:MAG: TonB-dependent receptor [Sphingobium sp.]